MRSPIFSIPVTMCFLCDENERCLFLQIGDRESGEVFFEADLDGTLTHEFLIPTDLFDSRRELLEASVFNEDEDGCQFDSGERMPIMKFVDEVTLINCLSTLEILRRESDVRITLADEEFWYCFDDVPCAIFSPTDNEQNETALLLLTSSME